MQHWSRRLLFIAVLFVSLNVGCRSRSNTATHSGTATSSSAAADYANAYKALMISYRARIGELTSRPLPPRSLPPEKKRAALARQVDDVADAYKGFASMLDALHPPFLLQEVHSSTRSFFAVSADDTHRWADAIRHGDRAARTRAEHQLDADSLGSLARMQQALKRAGAGGQAQQMQGEIDQVKREMGK